MTQQLDNKYISLIWSKGMHKQKYLIAGNWKMNGTLESLSEIVKIDKASAQLDSDLVLCVPNTIIHAASEKITSTKLLIGAQNCHQEENGAFTGDISATMLKNVGAKMIIVGHSERRLECAETSNLVEKKAAASIRTGLPTIICIGETEEQKIKGETETVVCSQLEHSMPDASNDLNTIIAYEPVWAIGTGKVPTLEDIAHVHRRIRNFLKQEKGEDISQKMRILYGGSVKPENAKEIFSLEDVDGALVGGASLKADDFINIAKQAEIRCS